jgi:heme exporter protein B
MLLLAPQPLALMLFGKVLVHWLTTAVPLLIATPLLAELLYLRRACCRC